MGDHGGGGLYICKHKLDFNNAEEAKLHALSDNIVA